MIPSVFANMSDDYTIHENQAFSAFFCRVGAKECSWHLRRLSPPRNRGDPFPSLLISAAGIFHISDGLDYDRINIMSGIVPVFRSPDGEARAVAAYEAVLANWPVPYEEQDLPTRFGTTHMVVSGSESSKPLV
jgi:hypothetical protein